jgi:nucleoside-diphosphate-sugar epimerase
MAFRVSIIGGTGQVGAAVARALAVEPTCAEVVMVNRKAISLTADPRLRQVIVDTAAARFPAEVTEPAQRMVAQGDLPVTGLARARWRLMSRRKIPVDFLETETSWAVR